MKNKMKWFIATTGIIALAVMFSAIIVRKPVQAQIGSHRPLGCCDQWTARGQGIAGGPDTFLVDAEFNLSGGPFSGVFGARSLQIKSTARLLAQSPPSANGAINAITSHVFEVKGQSDQDGVCESGEDCWVTLDRATLTPTTTPGLMDLSSTLAVTDGKGRFAKACGKVDGGKGEGQINFAAAPPTVRWSFSGGRLCECP